MRAENWKAFVKMAWEKWSSWFSKRIQSETTHSHTHIQYTCISNLTEKFVTLEPFCIRKQFICDFLFYVRFSNETFKRRNTSSFKQFLPINHYLVLLIIVILSTVLARSKIIKINFLLFSSHFFSSSSSCSFQLKDS